MNQLKGTGIQKVTIGEPWTPNTGNWIHVKAQQRIKHLHANNVVSYTELEHTFKVADFNDILPRLLELAARYNAAASA